MLIFLLTGSLVFSAGLNIAEITKAFSEGDIETLSAYLDDSVELGIIDDEDIYDQKEALKVLKSFFEKYPPRAYSQVHQGTSKSKDSVYCIGNLVTQDATFRVYIYMRVSGETHLIQEIRMDKE